jgi:magnesium-transporting ATPase (P-type)
MKRINSLQDYRKCFADEKKRKEALKQALDIRKFEIELYWKRTAYFWTLIAATFAGYLAIKSKSVDETALLLVASIGLCFSVGWYFVNRGSKYWQGNWERHVDALEDEFHGPLYKITPNINEFKFLKLNSAYPFSVSRINQILSLFVVSIWISLFISSLAKINWLPFTDNILSWMLAIMSVTCFISLFLFGRTKKSDEAKVISFECREYKKH